MKTTKYLLIAFAFMGIISLSSCLVERGPGWGPHPYYHHHYYHGGYYYR